jgi:diguanylate cyclase (GGDEF)-like protein
VTEGEAVFARDGLRAIVRTAEDLIGATVELVAHAGAAHWCAYLVPDAGDAWRVALAAGAGAPSVGAVWSPEEVAHVTRHGVHTAESGDAFASGSIPPLIWRHIHLPSLTEQRAAPSGLLCAAPNGDHPVERHQRVTRTLHTMLDHLVTLVGHHAGEVPWSDGDEPFAPPAPGAPGDVPRTGRRVYGLKDSATGLLARDVVLARLDDEVARARRYGGGLSVLLCELDQLDALAGVAGPALRDAIYATVGDTLRTCLRQIDCAGRYGAQAILLVLPETAADEALRAATRLANYLSQAVAAVDVEALVEPQRGAPSDREAPAEVPPVVLRMGASTYPVPARSAADLVSQAQDALAAVRASGGEAWLAHALDRLNEPPAGGFRCVCRRCGKVFEVMDRAQQRARRFCSHECYALTRRAGGQERDDQIRELRRAGHSLREIARQFGLSAERVRQILEVPGPASAAVSPISAALCVAPARRRGRL